MKFINYLIIAFFQCTRPLLGPAYCKFPISCGNFAIQELQEKTIMQAIISIGKRVISCNPFSNVSFE